MAAQETNLYNAFETTLTATAGSSDLTFTVNSVTAPTSITLAVPFYLVINPDSSTNREVVEITSINTGTKTLTCSGIGKRYLAGSAATSGLSHASGSTVRMSPVEQHIEDLNDRVDKIINEAGTAVNTSLFLDEDDMSTDSATKGVTQQSVKAYVDAQVTAQDLDLISDSGTIDIDLDSESLTVSGGEGIDTSATGTTLTIAGEDASTSNKGVASFSSDNFAVSSGAVTIKDSGVDLTAEVTGTLPVGNGGTGATTLTDGGVLLGSGTSAVTATAVLTNGQLLIGDGTGDPTVGSLTGTSPIGITPGAGSITIAASDASTSAKGVASFSSDNFSVSSGAVTIKTGGVDNDELAGSIANAKLANSTVSYGGISLALGASDSTPAFDLADATNYPTSSLSGTITNAQLAGSIANAKLSNSSITVSDGSSSTATSLGGTITFSGTSNEVDVGESSGTITVGLPSTITVNVTGNVSGSSGSTTGNAATATALATARNIGGVSFDGTGNIDLPGVNSAGNQNTSGTAADLSATLDETKGGTGLTSYAAGDILYASASNTLAKLTKGSASNVLTMNSGATAPEWSASGAGGVALQVVYQQAATTITSSDTAVDITTLDITITPASTSSAIMVGIGSCPIQVPDRDDNNYWGLRIDRAIGGASASTIYTNSQLGRATTNTPTDFRDGQGFSFIDKPNTTSECVYEFIFICDGGGSSEAVGIGKGFICTSYGIEYSSATEV